MRFRFWRKFFLLILVVISFSFAKAILAFSTEIISKIISPPSEEILSKPLSSTLSEKKLTTRVSEEESNFWVKTQIIKKKMFKEDQEDSSHPEGPIVVNVPSLKLKDSHCVVRPKMASLWTKCSW